VTVPSPTPAATTARPLFCAYGGVGIVPSPLPPDYDTQFVSVVLELDHPGPPSALRVSNVELLDASGKVATSMRRVTEMVVLDAAKTPPGRTEPGSWAFFLNPPAEKFEGMLGKGRTRLRLRASLKSAPTGFAPRVRVTLESLPTPLVVEGEVWGVWPT